jgi:hypothetical protein
MRRLPRPFCEFCHREDGTFDYDEFHAVCMGFLFPLWLWPLVILRDKDEANRLWRSEPWYIALGTSLRVLVGIAAVKGVL